MKNKVIILTVLAAGLLVWLYQTKAETKNLELSQNTEQLVKGAAVTQAAEVKNNPNQMVLRADATDFFSAASSAYAEDMETGNILYQKNAYSPWSPASLTKIMTALVVVSLVSEDKQVVISEDDLLVPSPKMGLRAGEVISTGDLLKGMLISSANDAALALARSVGGTHDKFISYMNLYAERLGLKTTHFQNPVGFDDPGQFVSANDIAVLAKEFLRVPILAEIVDTRSAVVKSTDGAVTHDLSTTNQLLSRENVFGVKTGFTDEARGNLLILNEHPSGRRFLTVILGSEQRELDSISLIDWIDNSYELQQ